MLPLIKLLQTAPSPSESSSLKSGLSEDQVSPGFLGFLLTFFIVVLTVFLIVDMVRRIRRVRYRAQVSGELAVAGPTDAELDAADSTDRGEIPTATDGGPTDTSVDASVDASTEDNPEADAVEDAVEADALENSASESSAAQTPAGPRATGRTDHGPRRH